MARRTNGGFWAVFGKAVAYILAIAIVAFAVIWIVGWAWKGMVNPIEFIKSWIPVVEEAVDATGIAFRPMRLLC